MSTNVIKLALIVSVSMSILSNSWAQSVPEGVLRVDAASDVTWEREVSVGTLVTVEKVSTNAVNTPGNVSFGCSAYGFGVNVFLKPREESPSDGKQSRVEIKYKNGKIFINDEEHSSSKWSYNKLYPAVSARDTDVGVAIYNAVIRRENVTFKLSGKNPVELILPPPNNDFAEFGAECGLGVKAKD